MLRALYKTVIPYGVRKRIGARLKAHFDDQSAYERAKQILPKVPLDEKHLHNCQVLFDRSALLSCLPRGGIVAEIGVAQGDFSQLIWQTCEPKELHLIDAWNSNRFPLPFKASVRDRFLPEAKEGRIHIHRSLSVDAARNFPDAYFDWVYIDTDHSYSTTLAELLAYAPKIKPDGLIAGHDYCMGNWVTSYRYGVIEAVHEFCGTHGWELAYLTLEPSEHQSFAIRRMPRDS